MSLRLTESSGYRRSVRTDQERRRNGLVVSVGIEGTFEPCAGKDTLSVTGHFKNQRWSNDFKLVRDLGVTEVRYPVPWHMIEREPGRFSWRRLDRVLGSACDEYGLTIIADPLHHTSYPRWLNGGFLNPGFAAAYAKFVQAFAERYPFVDSITPFNEPTCTLDFCGDRGFWHPHARGDHSYVTMLRHTARATAEAIQRFRELRNFSFVLHVDTFERHAALDEASAARARFLNERRFLFEELLIGRVDTSHPLQEYLLQHGFSSSDLAWHLENPVQIDERGGNYYPLSEEELLDGRTHFAPSEHPVGFAGLVREYAARLPFPLSLTETNIQGTAGDRISWLKYMLEQTELLNAEGLHLQRFAWYPLFDCAGWNSLLQGKRWKRDPQGIFSCDREWGRSATDFSRIYQQVAAGMSSKDIPPYAFTARHDRTLNALKRQMEWEWIDQNDAAGETDGARLETVFVDSSREASRVGSQIPSCAADDSANAFINRPGG